MKWGIVEKCSLDDVLANLCENRSVFALVEENEAQYRFERAEHWMPGRHTLGAYRQVDPVKSLLFRPRENLGAWTDDSSGEQLPECIVIGVKNCDLSGLAIHDHVFLDGDVPDPHYAEAREKTVLVTADCTGCLDVCFCPVVGVTPYPTQSFDINIGFTPKGYVLEGGTERGAELLRMATDCLEPANDDLLQALEAQRAAMDRRLVENAAACGLEPGMDLRKATESRFESRLWEDFAADCVECGACNFICCTCHCFMLVDGLDGSDNPARCKQWDSCLFPGYARTAGGDPRPLRAQRLRNRFDKKFIFFPEVMGRYACDGCGRCTEACIGHIDIRAVLKRAVDESGTLHADPGDD